MPISLSGVGSGLDIQSIVTQLVAAEGQAKTSALNSREASYKSELSAIGKIKSALSSFSDASKALKDPENLLAVKASSSSDSLFSAAASSTATSGTYSVEVSNLASAQKLSSTGFATADEAVGSGFLYITSGENSFEVEITSDKPSLSDIRDAINSKTDNESVIASVILVDDGLGGSEARLVLTAKNTGTENAITVTVDDDDGTDTDTSGLSQLAYDSGAGVTNLSELVPAEDALIRIDTLDVTRSSNTITDAISGVTLELKSEGTGVLEVGVDNEGTKDRVQSFVDSYNALISTYKSLTGYNSETETAGALLGDFTTRSAVDGLRTILRETSSNPSYPSLFSVGIELDKDGLMRLDSTKLNSVLSTAPEALTNLLSGEEGIAGRITENITGLLELGGGFSNRSKSINTSLDRIEVDRERLDLRLSKLETSLLDQFIAMDLLVAQYSSTGSYLSNQLAALPGFSSK